MMVYFHLPFAIIHPSIEFAVDFHCLGFSFEEIKACWGKKIMNAKAEFGNFNVLSAFSSYANYLINMKFIL